MDPGVERLGRLGVDVALADHAAERDLDVLARAAEPVIEIEVAERGVEVVAPHQADRPLAEPDAFGDARRGRSWRGSHRQCRRCARRRPCRARRPCPARPVSARRSGRRRPPARRPSSPHKPTSRSYALQDGPCHLLSVCWPSSTGTGTSHAAAIRQDSGGLRPRISHSSMAELGSFVQRRSGVWIMGRGSSRSIRSGSSVRGSWSVPSWQGAQVRAKCSLLAILRSRKRRPGRSLHGTGCRPLRRDARGRRPDLVVARPSGRGAGGRRRPRPHPVPVLRAVPRQREPARRAHPGGGRWRSRRISPSSPA